MPEINEYDETGTSGAGGGRRRTPHIQSKSESARYIRTAIPIADDFNMPDWNNRKGFNERNRLGDSLANRAIVPVAKRMMNFVACAVVAEKVVNSTEVAFDDVRMPKLNVKS